MVAFLRRLATASSPRLLACGTNSLLATARSSLLTRIPPLGRRSAPAALLAAASSAALGLGASIASAEPASADVGGAATAGEQADGQYERPISKFDDPEYNARMLQQWRSHIAAARDMFARKDFDGAEESLKLALEEAEHWGTASGPFATSMLNLAQLYRKRGRHADAAPLLQKAFYVLEQNAGPNNKVTLLALIDLASTLYEQGEAAAAKERFDDALQRLDAAQVHQVYANAPEALRDVRAGCLLQAAQAELKLGETARAEAQLREALSLTEERWGAASPRLVAPCAELARLLLAAGRRDEAREMGERAARVATHPAQKAGLAGLLKEIG